MIDNLHGPYACEINSGSKLGGITSMGISMGPEVRGEATSDEVWRRWLSVVGERPTARVSTLNPAAGLALVGLTGTDLSSNNLILYAQKRADAGTRTAGATHRKYTFADGIIVPRTLSCGYGGDALLELLAVPRSEDGTSHPLEITAASALPASITDAERFTLPPADSIDVGGKALSNVRSVEVDFGVIVAAEAADDDLWDTFTWIRLIAPVITIRGVDIGWLAPAMVPISPGIACTHANTQVYFRKKVDTGTLLAVATAEHIKITAAGMAVVTDAFEGEGECTIQIVTKYDGTNPPLVITSNSAIT